MTVFLLTQGYRHIGIFYTIEAAMSCPVWQPPAQPDHWHTLEGPHQWQEKTNKTWTLQESQCAIREMEVRSS